MKPSSYIKKYGWKKGDFGVEGGPTCLLTALSVTLGDGKRYQEACNKLRKATRRSCLSFWNDRPNRTKEEVIEVLESVGL